MKKFILIIILIFNVSIYSEEPQAINIEHSLLSSQKENDELVHNLFFAVNNNKIYIPILNKNEVAVFDNKSKLENEIKFTEELCSQLKYFSVTEDGDFIIYSNRYLYLIDNNGNTKWKYDATYNFFPEKIYYANGYFYLIQGEVEGKDNRSIVLNKNGQVAGRIGVKKASSSFAVILDRFGKAFPYILKNKIYLKDFRGFETNENYKLLFVNERSDSYWINTDKDNSITIEVYDVNTVFKIKKHLEVKDKNSMWIFPDRLNDTIYIAFSSDRKMKIEKYSF